MTSQEFQSQIIDSFKCQGACEGQFNQLLSATDKPAHFLSILRYNHAWCVKNKIYTPELLLQLDAELLLRGGYATHGMIPIGFQPVEINGNVWAPFNHGASIEDINGSYHDFDEALTLDYGDWRQSTPVDFTALAGAPSWWGIYANTFGRIFGGNGDNLFLPASGLRNNSDGSFNNVGSDGFYWSSVQYSSYGCNLYFYSGSVSPQGSYDRRYGFTVRCVQ